MASGPALAHHSFTIFDTQHPLELSGTVHELWTGVCLWVRPGDRQITWQERSLVRMRPLTDAEIDAYLKTRKWEGCSGAYAIQVPDDPYLTVVDGSVSNVIGLPMESLEKALGWMALVRV